MNDQTVLLTRSNADNRILKSILEPMGFICFNCDLLQFHDIPFDYSILDNYTDIIITSKHAASLLPPQLVKKQGKFAWVVGETSARILEEKGYIVKLRANSAKVLKDSIPIELYPKILYLSANIISTKMPPEIERRILYNVIYKDFLREDIINRLRKGINFILLYSENCAKTLIKLLLENNLLKYLEDTMVIGISSKVEQVIKPFFTYSIACDSASQMIQTLENYARSK